MLTVVTLGLASAFGSGGADYLSGMAARRATAIQITLLVYAAGTIAMLAALPWWWRSGTPQLSSCAWGALSGVGVACEALLLAEGFRRAEFSVAAPLSAVIGAALAVAAGLALGNRPGPWTWTGMALALAAIAAVSVSTRPGGYARHGRFAGVGFGVAAGIGCAISFTGLGRASPAAGMWPVFAAEAAALTTTWAVAAVLGDLNFPPSGARLASVSSGVIAAAASALYLLAAHAGSLAVAAVLTSLFPAVTVGLARMFDSERLGKIRLVGLVLAVLSISLIALGGVSATR
jgi:drug/metabolite transporter (DMT)-like permease